MYIYSRTAKHTKGNELPDSFFTSTFSQSLVWHTGCFNAGDLILFDGHTVHGTSQNRTSRYRLSVDTRYYLAPERENVADTIHGQAVARLTYDV